MLAGVSAANAQPARAVIVADPLAGAYAAAIADPTNVEAQLRYARAAEAAGKIEAAFPVYERVLALQPGNAEAAAGLRRIRNAIQPARHETFYEFGVQYETNPQRLPSGTDPEFQLFGNMVGTHERPAGDMRWRTVARLAGIWHGEQRDLNYGYAGGVTGPVIAVGTDSQIHAAIGGGASTFGGRFFYYEAEGDLTFEVGAAGATQTVRLRGGWRQYDPFWVTTNGFWADLTGKFIWPQTQSGGAFILTPWLRWSDVAGTFVTGINIPEEVTPGHYLEAGGRFEVLHALTPRLTAGVNVTGSIRNYTAELVPSTTTNRLDTTLSPGASLVFPYALGHADVRLRYNYILNNSNDDAHDYRDHVVALSVGGRF